MELVSSTGTRKAARAFRLLTLFLSCLLLSLTFGNQSGLASENYPSAKLLHSSEGLIGYVDATSLAKDWAKYYAPGLVYSHAFVKSGSSFKLIWLVTDSAGHPLVNTPVTLQANKAYGGNNAHFASSCIDIPAGIADKNAAEIFSETDKNGYATFTISSLDANGEAEDTPVTQIDRNSKIVYGQFSLQIKSLGDLEQSKEIVEVHVIGKGNSISTPACYGLPAVKAEYAKSVVVPAPHLQPTKPSVQGFTVGNLIWSDEFAQKIGKSPSSTYWTSRLCGTSNRNGGGIYCSGDQYYSPQANGNDSAGNMVITTTGSTAESKQLGDCQAISCPFVSGRFDSQGKLAVRYGYLEARIKLPSGVGQNPAFWLLGDNITRVGWPASGEIDVMEQPLIRANQNAGSLHFSTSYSGCCDNHQTLTHTFTGQSALSSAFHRYGILWQPGKITFYLDGKQYGSFSKVETNTKFWPFDAPAFLIFDNSTPGVKGEMTWNVSKLQIDYVRLWKANGYGSAWMH